MSASVPGPNGLLVGAKGEGTAFKNIRLVSSVVTTGVVSTTVNFLDVTVTGISAALDLVVLVAQPTQSALGVNAVSAQAGASDDRIRIFYDAPSATGVTPNTGGTYKFLVFRVAPY
jgi:hypothetical protein